MFCLLEIEFFIAVFSILDYFKILISFLSSVISFSYFSFFLSFVCDVLRDGEIRKGLDGLGDRSFSFIFLLLDLELVFVKLGLFSGARAVT